MAGRNGSRQLSSTRGPSDVNRVAGALAAWCGWLWYALVLERGDRSGQHVLAHVDGWRVVRGLDVSAARRATCIARSPHVAFHGIDAADHESEPLRQPQRVVPGRAHVTHLDPAQSDAASHTNPSGSVNGPASLPTTRRCDPVPSGETPATLASARRLWSVSLTGPVSNSTYLRP